MSSNLDFSKLGGLLPAVVQDHADGRVLMVGFMNEESFQRTVQTGRVTFFSRSRNELWTKGGSSGHYLLVKDIQVDCDLDSVLIQVEALGPGVCHNGFRRVHARQVRAVRRREEPGMRRLAGEPQLVVERAREVCAHVGFSRQRRGIAAADERVGLPAARLRRHDAFPDRGPEHPGQPLARIQEVEEIIYADAGPAQPEAKKVAAGKVRKQKA